MSDLRDLSELHAETEQNRFNFLQTDLDLCNTFANVAETELRMEDREAAQRALAKAEDGYVTIARLLLRVKKPEHREEIEQGLNKLRITLDNVQRLVNG